MQAYVSQTQTATRRLIGALQTIQNDPTYVGHVSDRLITVVPWSVERLTKFIEDPVKSRDRINYHACALASSTGELLILLEDPPAAVVCQGEAIRSNACKDLISKRFQKHIDGRVPHLDSVCN